MILNSTYGRYEDVYLIVGWYEYYGSIAIEVWNDSDGPIVVLTKCLCDKTLAENEAYVDTNNFPEAIEFIEQNGLGKMTGKYRQSGYCSYPLVRFDMERVRENGTAH